MPRGVTDTSPYVGHLCSICGKLVKLSHNNGWYRWDVYTKQVEEAAHIACKFPNRKAL